MSLILIEEKFGRFFKNNSKLLLLVIFGGLLIRIIFTNWNYPSVSNDTFVFMIEAIEFKSNNFLNFNPRFIWPSLLTIIFSFFNFEDYFGYLTIMRIVSIAISTISIPIVYLISKSFLTKWVIIPAFLFSFEPNVIMNSTLAITESIFILLGLIAIYFIINRKDYTFLFGFVFAALAFDTRLNGIVLLFVAIIGCIRLIPKKKGVAYMILGIGIFALISSPHLITYGETNTGGTFERIIGIMNSSSIGKISPHLYSIFETISQTSEEGEQSKVLEQNVTKKEIYKRALVKEILHVGLISIPFLVFLIPVGLFTIFRNINFQKIILICTIIISFLIAIPQYTLSAEYRNLLFIIPMFCIIAGIGTEEIFLKLKRKKIFAVVFVSLIIVSSLLFLSYISVDEKILGEKIQFAKYVAENYNGIIMGDSTQFIGYNFLDIPNNNLDLITNNKIELVNSFFTIDSKDGFSEFIESNNVNYIIIDDDFDNRYPIFRDIYNNQDNYGGLKLVFDSKENNYSHYNVKIFIVSISD